MSPQHEDPLRKQQQQRKQKEIKLKSCFDELRNLPIALRLAVKTITRNKKTVCCVEREGRVKSATHYKLKSNIGRLNLLIMIIDAAQVVERKEKEKRWRCPRRLASAGHGVAMPRVSFEWSYLCTTCYGYPSSFSFSFCLQLRNVCERRLDPVALSEGMIL